MRDTREGGVGDGEWKLRTNTESLPITQLSLPSPFTEIRMT